MKVSPYLEQPLRTVDQAEADRRRAAALADPKDAPLKARARSSTGAAPSNAGQGSLPFPRHAKTR